MIRKLLPRLVLAAVIAAAFLGALPRVQATPIYTNTVVYQWDSKGDVVPITLASGPSSYGYVLGYLSNGNLGLVANPNVIAATATTMGGVIVPTSGNLSVDGSGNISVPAATNSVLGVVSSDAVTMTNTNGAIAFSGKIAPYNTAGSGTGITVNYNGVLGRQILKITVTHAGLSAASKTVSATLTTLAAKTRIVGVIADVTTAFTGGGESAATIAVGTTTGDQLILAADCLTAAATYGLTDNQLGADFARADAIQGGWLPSWTTTTAITCTLVTTTNNTSSLTAGSATFYIITESM